MQTERITDTATVVLVCESPEGIVIDRMAVDELKSQKVKEIKKPESQRHDIG